MTPEQGRRARLPARRLLNWSPRAHSWRPAAGDGVDRNLFKRPATVKHQGQCVALVGDHGPGQRESQLLWIGANASSTGSRRRRVVLADSSVRPSPTLVISSVVRMAPRFRAVSGWSWLGVLG